MFGDRRRGGGGGGGGGGVLDWHYMLEYLLGGLEA